MRWDTLPQRLPASHRPDRRPGVDAAAGMPREMPRLPVTTISSSSVDWSSQASSSLMNQKTGAIDGLGCNCGLSYSSCYGIFAVGRVPAASVTSQSGCGRSDRVPFSWPRGIHPRHLRTHIACRIKACDLAPQYGTRQWLPSLPSVDLVKPAVSRPSAPRRLPRGAQPVMALARRRRERMAVSAVSAGSADART
jgi:hypothetical protein